MSPYLEQQKKFSENTKLIHNLPAYRKLIDYAIKLEKEKSDLIEWLEIQVKELESSRYIDEQDKASANGKSVWLGLFDCKVEAAKAYDKKAIELHGEFAYVNYPKLNQGK